MFTTYVVDVMRCFPQLIPPLSRGNSRPQLLFHGLPPRYFLKSHFLITVLNKANQRLPLVRAVNLERCTNTIDNTTRLFFPRVASLDQVIGVSAFVCSAQGDGLAVTGLASSVCVGR